MTQPAVTYTLPACAHIAAVPERALRGYLDAGFPLIVPAGRKRAWLRVAPIDAARLAVFAKLVQWGLTVREAASIVRDFFDCLLIGAGADPAVVDWPALIHCAANVGLSISRDGTGRLALPRGRPAVEQPTLTIDLAATVRDAHHRAGELAAHIARPRASSPARGLQAPQGTGPERAKRRCQSAASARSPQPFPSAPNVAANRSLGT